MVEITVAPPPPFLLQIWPDPDPKPNPGCQIEVCITFGVMNISCNQDSKNEWGHDLQNCLTMKVEARPDSLTWLFANDSAIQQVDTMILANLHHEQLQFYLQQLTVTQWEKSRDIVSFSWKVQKEIHV